MTKLSVVIAIASSVMLQTALRAEDQQYAPGKPVQFHSYGTSQYSGWGTNAKPVPANDTHPAATGGTAAASTAGAPKTGAASTAGAAPQAVPTTGTPGTTSTTTAPAVQSLTAAPSPVSPEELGKSMNDAPDAAAASSGEAGATPPPTSTKEAIKQKFQSIDPQKAAAAAAGIGAALGFGRMIPGLGGVLNRVPTPHAPYSSPYSNPYGTPAYTPPPAAPVQQPQVIYVQAPAGAALPAGAVTIPGTVVAPPAAAVTQTVKPDVSGKIINTPIHDKWAVIVGVSKFQDSTIPTLHYAAKDASDFYKYLTTEGHFAPDHVRLLLNEKATQREVLSEIGDKFLPRVVKPDDLVVFFFSSHGSPASKDVAKENFLVAYDTEKTNLYATGIEMQNLTRILRERVKANRILIVLDACHSGGGADGAKDAEPGGNFNLSNIQLGAGQLMICSSSQEERSWESKRYQNGVFTKRFIEGLQKNGPKTKLVDAFKHVQNTVGDEVQQDEAASQTPKMKSDTWKGNDLLLAVPPHAPGPLPETVQKLLGPDSR